MEINKYVCICDVSGDWLKKLAVAYVVMWLNPKIAQYRSHSGHKNKGTRMFQFI